MPQEILTILNWILMSIGGLILVVVLFGFLLVVVIVGGLVFYTNIANRLTNTKGSIELQKVDNLNTLENGKRNVTAPIPQPNSAFIKIQEQQPLEFVLKPFIPHNSSKKVIFHIKVAGQKMTAVMDTSSPWSFISKSALNNAEAMLSNQLEGESNSDALSLISELGSNSETINESVNDENTSKRVNCLMNFGKFEIYQLFYIASQDLGAPEVILGMDFANSLDILGIILTVDNSHNGLQLDSDLFPLSNCHLNGDLNKYSKIFECSNLPMPVIKEKYTSEEANDISDRIKRVKKVSTLRLKMFSDNSNMKFYNVGDILAINFSSPYFSQYSCQNVFFQIEKISMSDYRKDSLLYIPYSEIKCFAYKTPTM